MENLKINIQNIQEKLNTINEAENELNDIRKSLGMSQTEISLGASLTVGIVNFSTGSQLIQNEIDLLNGAIEDQEG